MSLVVLIPALNPSDELLMVVKSLASDQSVAQIILINDGSASSFDEVFQQASTSPKVTFLQHATNLGKGAALRTGINHFLCHAAANSILVTADADGQHLPEDIIAVGRQARDKNHTLILGTRVFGSDVPCRSKFGNNMTRWVFRMLIGKRINDTQTGLRVIPRCIMPQLLKLKASGYAFELEMLILAARNGVSIEPFPIQTVYLHGNQSSHFKPVLDSVRIYLVFVRFIAPFLLSLIVDLSLFALIWNNTRNLLLSMTGSRLMASGLSYVLNTRWVFHFTLSKRRSLSQYTLFVVVLGGTSFFFIDALIQQFGWNAIAAKALVESLLFFSSYGLQRDLGFASSKDKAPVSLASGTAPAKL
ncbi:hypothetical protein BH11VER1_BH11VER1_16470 [soil metagenome]